MGENQDPQAELLRRFEAVTGGEELADLRRLAGDLLAGGAGVAEDAGPAPEPELRRPPLDGLRLFRIRVDLQRSRPPIWRRLEVRSDLTLDVVHQVLQAAFGWTDSHLYRFSLGGDPFDRGTQTFLCPWDVEEGELEDEGSIAASDARIDEAMQQPGDILSYLYDYGDNWSLTLRLEDVRPAACDAPSAVAVDGRRAAPPEDCGSLLEAADLAEVLEDPSYFDVGQVNAALRGPFFALREYGIDPRLIDLVNRLTYSPIGDDLTTRATRLMTDTPPLGEQQLRASLGAFTWFLDRAADGGLPMTAAGYLKPMDVQAAARVVPWMSDWIGKANRELDTTPVLHFRELMQSLGLLRKYKGTLRLTRAGSDAQAAPELLWNRLADGLVPSGESFDRDASLLLLAYAATSPREMLPLDAVAKGLAHLGWRTTGSNRAVEPPDLYWLPTLSILTSITSEPSHRRDRWRITPQAASLAHAALRRA